MPELPEVEVTRRGLSARLPGQRITGLRLGKPLRWPLQRDEADLQGWRVAGLARRGKYLWMGLRPPEAPGAWGAAHAGPTSPPAAVLEPHWAVEPGPQAAEAAADAAALADLPGLLWHLGMSGALHWWEGAAPPPGPHDHVDLHLEGGLLRLTDPRRFGAVVWSQGLNRPPASDRLASLGAEPWDPALTAARFHAALQARRQPIKQVLLGGQVVVGAGNIYACEALFLAGIDPRTPAERLGRQRAARLLEALREVLARAIGLGGSTLRDFHDAHGASGAFQAQAAVYGREGLPCPRCATPIRRMVQAQRSTFFCPRCQRP